MYAKIREYLTDQARTEERVVASYTGFWNDKGVKIFELYKKPRKKSVLLLIRYKDNKNADKIQGGILKINKLNGTWGDIFKYAEIFV